MEFLNDAIPDCISDAVTMINSYHSSDFGYRTRAKRIRTTKIFLFTNAQNRRRPTLRIALNINRLKPVFQH